MAESNVGLSPKRILQYLSKTSWSATVIGVCLFMAVLFGMCFTYVRPYEIGIKQVNIGFNAGIQEKEYGPGLHFIKPFGFEYMHIFPNDIQILSLTSSDRLGRRHVKSAHIQTSDGFFVDVDVSILYRITDPYRVLVDIGAGMLYINNGILPKAEPALKETLGQLTTEEFYNPYLRVEKMKLAKDKLRAELIEKGIEVTDVLIRYFRYSDEIQRNIEEKKLKDQLVYKNQSERRAAIEGANLAKIVEEGEAKITVTLQEGQSYVVRKTAERDRYVRTQEAKANLLVKEAEAYKTRLKNNALKGRGSENLVGLKMAEVLDGVEAIVLPSDGKGGFNPLDLDGTIKLFD